MDPGDDQPFIGFFLPGKIFTPYSVPGSLGTTLNAINDHGDFADSYGLTDGNSVAFANIGGNLIILPFPEGRAGATGVNSSGELVGYSNLPWVFPSARRDDHH